MQTLRVTAPLSRRPVSKVFLNVRVMISFIVGTRLISYIFLTECRQWQWRFPTDRVRPHSDQAKVKKVKEQAAEKKRQISKEIFAFSFARCELSLTKSFCAFSKYHKLQCSPPPYLQSPLIRTWNLPTTPATIPQPHPSPNVTTPTIHPFTPILSPCKVLSARHTDNHTTPRPHPLLTIHHPHTHPIPTPTLHPFPPIPTPCNVLITGHK